MRIAIAIHGHPVWCLPESEIHRIVRALPHDDVVPLKTPEGRQAAVGASDVLFGLMEADEYVVGSPLKWIHSPSVGVTGLIGPDLAASNVVVTNSRGVHSDPIAEHALALVLCLRRGLHIAARHQFSQEWAQHELAQLQTERLGDTRLLVVGLGAIGAKVALLGSALGMRVTGVRRRAGGVALPGVERVVTHTELRDVLPDADVIVLAVPSTPATQQLIGLAELERVKPTAIIINVGRGDLIDEQALVAFLARSPQAAAGLDVFEREPLPPDHLLWRLPNVLISPHVAPFTHRFWGPLVGLFLENLDRFRQGRTLLNVVDKRAGY